MQENERELLQLRTEIDLIHSDMVHLFRRRLQLVKKIWELKKNNKSPMVDPAREDFIIHQFDLKINDAIEQKTVQNFLKSILSESKKYMGHS